MEVFKGVVIIYDWGGGQRENMRYSQTYFTLPFAEAKFSLPHQRQVGKKFTPPSSLQQVQLLSFSLKHIILKISGASIK